eukprot:s887_g21.t1
MVRFMHHCGERADHTQAEFEAMGLALESQISELSTTESEQLLPALQQHFAETPAALQAEMMLRLMAQSHICEATGGSASPAAADSLITIGSSGHSAFAAGSFDASPRSLCYGPLLLQGLLILLRGHCAVAAGIPGPLMLLRGSGALPSILPGPLMLLRGRRALPSILLGPVMLLRGHRALPSGTFDASPRWQSVSSFLLAMEPLELPLRQFWNLQAFRAKAQDAQPHTSTSDQPDAEEAGPDDTAQVADALVAAGAGEGQVLAEAVRGKIRSQNFDLAVQNASVWQYMSMLRKLFAISDELLAWFQACPCHPPGEASEDDDLCKHYAACPMKGRRAPELAAGFIVDFMRERLQSAADVFPSNSDLFLEYVAGLQHFSFMLQLKFASWAAMPHSFLALAHPSERTARVACRRLLGEWEFLSEGDKQSAHPLCHAFMSDTSVRDSLVRFGQGSGRDSDDCVQMRAVLGPIAFLPVLERSIEGRHAVVKRATERAPNHRGAYVANVLRSAAIMDAAAKDPKMLVEMAEHFDRLRLPVFVIQHLGLKSNASVVALGRLPQKQADKQLQSFGFLDRVMFRLDAATQFADWEDFLDAKQRHSKGKLPLMVADANSMQRHLALEHFRVTATSSSDFFAATLQDAGPGTPATDFPFRQLQCTLAGNARFVDACLDDAGQVALIEADPQCGDGQGQGFAVAST